MFPFDNLVLKLIKSTVSLRHAVLVHDKVTQLLMYQFKFWSLNQKILNECHIINTIGLKDNDVDRLETMQKLTVDFWWWLALQ